MRRTLIVRIAVALAIAVLFMVGLGQGCGKFDANLLSGSSESSLAPTDGAANAEEPVLPNTGTVALVYGKQILDHYSSCLGSGIPSDRTLAMYSSKTGTISETGAVSTLTAPMLMAATSIAGEICKDLILAERTAPRIFIGIDLAGTTLPDEGSLQDSMRRIARSCWSRDEDPIESQIILDSVHSAFSGASGANTAHDAALFMCTSMLGALDSLVL